MGKNISVRFLNEKNDEDMNIDDYSISRHNDLVDVRADISIKNMPLYFNKVIADMLIDMSDAENTENTENIDTYKKFFEGLKILGIIGLTAVEHGNLDTEFTISYD